MHKVKPSQSHLLSNLSSGSSPRRSYGSHVPETCCLGGYTGIPWYTMVYHDVQTQKKRWCWVNKLHFKHLDIKSASSRVKLPISHWQRISMWVYLRQNEPTSPWRSAPVAGAHFALANCLLQPGQQHEENQRGTPDHPDAGPAGNEIETMAHPGMLWDLTK